MNSSPLSKETALITGASSGIGLALARQFALHGHPVVMVAPDGVETARLATQLASEYGVPVRSLAKDLTRENAAWEIFEELTRAGVRVGILVNNAGVGLRGKFHETPLEKDIEMIRLNIEAVVRLTKAFLPDLLARGRGGLLTTASVAGFEPGPLFAVYHATKAFVLSWTEALATELEDTGLTVTALCPGPVDTDFFPKADMVESRAFQKMKVMAPDEVAEEGYEAFMKGERVVVPGASNKIWVFSRRFLPESAQAKLNEKTYQDAPPEDQTRQRGDIERKYQEEHADELAGTRR